MPAGRPRTRPDVSGLGHQEANRLLRTHSRLGRDYGIGSGKFNHAPVVGRKSKVKLIPADGEEAKALPKRKITKVGVNQVIVDPPDFGDDRDNDNPHDLPTTQIIVAPHQPNEGTIFAGRTFLKTDNRSQESRRKLTEDKLQEVLFVLRDGGSLGDAADIVGVGKSSLDHLANRNEDWADAMRQAMAMGKLEHIRRVKGGDSNWQSSAWWLERKYRNEFGQNAQQAEETKQIRVRQVVKAAPQLDANNQRPQLEALTPEQLKEAEAGVKESPATTNVLNGVDKMIDVDGSEIEISQE